MKAVEEKNWYNILVHSEYMGSYFYLLKIEEDKVCGIWLNVNTWEARIFKTEDIQFSQIVNKSVLNTILKTFPMPTQYAPLFAEYENKFSKFYDKEFGS